MRCILWHYCAMFESNQNRPEPPFRPHRSPDDARVKPTGSARAESTLNPTSDEAKPKELHGPQGPEPTRFGDWERSGRCIDF